MIEYGRIPNEMEVMHKCDNPSCVRIDHLKLGTHRENIEDMIRKGRKTNARLTPSQVVEIRDLKAKGRTTREIASQFPKDCKQAVYRVCRGASFGAVL